MRALVLTTAAPNQVALVTKLRGACEIVGVVSSQNVPRRRARRRLRRTINAVAGRTVGRPFVSAWFSLQKRYADQYGPAFPAGLPVIAVQNVNDQPTLDAIAALSPDVLLVSGTNLVGTDVIRAMEGRVGVLNLHTGISPYVKGGPNCTNWCLARGWYDLIGNTVMWLDEGIDSGAIIATERTPLTGDESLLELHWQVMEHAHDLYARAVAALTDGRVGAGVPQDEIAPGVTFFNADWSAREMLRARRNMGTRFRVGQQAARGRAVRLVSLD